MTTSCNPEQDWGRFVCDYTQHTADPVTHTQRWADVTPPVDRHPTYDEERNEP